MRALFSTLAMAQQANSNAMPQQANTTAQVSTLATAQQANSNAMPQQANTTAQVSTLATAQQANSNAMPQQATTTASARQGNVRTASQDLAWSRPTPGVMGGSALAFARLENLPHPFPKPVPKAGQHPGNGTAGQQQRNATAGHYHGVRTARQRSHGQPRPCME
eukprot:Skav220216  [mRNA]  locus=scaffold1600:131137:131912:+ [translate_table: standard]